MLCGTYGSLNNFFTTDEIGDDLAENLTSKRQAVCDAWINSLEDWLTNNSPMIVAAEDRSRSIRLQEGLIGNLQLYSATT